MILYQNTPPGAINFLLDSRAGWAEPVHVKTILSLLLVVSVGVCFAEDDPEKMGHFEKIVYDYNKAMAEIRAPKKSEPLPEPTPDVEGELRKIRMQMQWDALQRQTAENLKQSRADTDAYFENKRQQEAADFVQEQLAKAESERRRLEIEIRKLKTEVQAEKP
jgi:hypothetical protein